ncbi:MAG: hypothetical protein ACRDJN_02235 [Chloroflexota bacterium]
MPVPVAAPMGSETPVIVSEAGLVLLIVNEPAQVPPAKQALAGAVEPGPDGRRHEVADARPALALAVRQPSRPDEPGERRGAYRQERDERLAASRAE